ncbi:hypothetical protein LC612_29825 [Nostoc sp. CHAB 5834]|nr:hypothetical protein [Nostoc sp. CHAB 5834]
MIPLLITSVVQTYATNSNLLKDERKRLMQTREAVFKIVDQKIFTHIVIADGSNFQIFDREEILSFARKGLIIEQICFQQNQDEVRVGGKSQGELQIIYYAIQNSKLIAEFGGFHKISGRYSVKNLSSIVSATQSDNNVFYFDNPPALRLGGRFVATIFYKVQTDFFLTHFDGASSECGYRLDGFLESIFYRRLVELQRWRCFAPFPLYEGVSGTTGKPLVNRHYWIRNVVSRLGGLCYAY